MFLLLLVLFIAAIFTSVQKRRTIITERLHNEQIVKNVPFCKQGDTQLLMDIYKPVQPIATKAAIVYVHGGGWVTQSKDNGFELRQIPGLVKRGFTVFAIDYRLAPQYKFPAQIEDVACAVRYLRANAASLNINPEKIGAFGESAGGHLVSLLGTVDRDVGFVKNGPYAHMSSSVQAVANLYGATEIARVPDGSVIDAAADQAFNTEHDRQIGSPIRYASSDDPPFLLIAGQKDTWVPPAQLEQFRDALRAAGASVKFVTVKNAFHGFVPQGWFIDPSLSEINQTLADFFADKLGT